MDVFHLHQTLAWFLTVCTVGLAADCSVNQFKRNGLCCDACPPGKYVREICTEQKPTVCVSCSEGTYSERTDILDHCLPCLKCDQDSEHYRPCTLTTNTNCSCGAGFRCLDHVCSKCELDKKCQKGEELKRTGSREYFYQCEPCPHKTYSDTGEGHCKQITQCGDIGLTVGFPGNRTHNSICHAHVQSDSLQIIAAGLFVFGFALLIYLCKTCIKKIRQRTRKARNYPETIISANVPETSYCPLSKEEIGEQLIQQMKLNSVDKRIPSLEQLNSGHNSIVSLEHQQAV